MEADSKYHQAGEKKAKFDAPSGGCMRINSISGFSAPFSPNTVHTKRHRE